MTTNQHQLRQSCLESADGVISEPWGWAGRYFGDGSAAHSVAALQRSSALLMGRRTDEVFSGQWPSASGHYADHPNAMPKYVFSSTLHDASWTNTTMVAGDRSWQLVSVGPGADPGLATLTFRPTTES